MRVKRILCCSNGHGEDSIAVTILQALSEYPVELLAMPIVGQGEAYQKLGIPIIGPTQTMPSGGFIYMDAKQLWRDLQEGLGGLTLRQIEATRQAAPSVDLILAVGDIVVQVLAWMCKRPHVFVGTAKSDYYIAGKPSVFAPWERWFMNLPECEASYPRDRITTLNLQKLGVNRAYDLGNPMMDGLDPVGFDWARMGLHQDQPLITLLPGSRPPEAYRNLQQLLDATLHLGPRPYVAALAGAIRGEALGTLGWSYHELAPDLACLDKEDQRVYLVWGAFADCLHRASLVLAMTGTATEQAVGLGKPVVSFIGGGPQFTYRFAEAQTRLLGPSVTLIADMVQLPSTAQRLLTDQNLLAQIRANGYERMGPVGAAQRIARHIMER